MHFLLDALEGGEIFELSLNVLHTKKSLLLLLFLSFELVDRIHQKWGLRFLWNHQWPQRLLHYNAFINDSIYLGPWYSVDLMVNGIGIAFERLLDYYSQLLLIVWQTLEHCMVVFDPVPKVLWYIESRPFLFVSIELFKILTFLPIFKVKKWYFLLNGGPHITSDDLSIHDAEFPLDFFFDLLQNLR